MSTILKALRRLEQERTRADRPLREQVTGPVPTGDPSETATPRRWPILASGVAAGVAAGLALLFLVLGRGDPARETPRQAEPAAPLASAVREVPAGPPLPAAPGPEALAPRPAPPPAPRAIAGIEEMEPSEPLEEVAVLDRGSPPPRIATELRPEPLAEPTAPPPGSVRPFEHARPQAATAQRAAARARSESSPAPQPRVPEPDAPAPAKRPAPPAAKASASPPPAAKASASAPPAALSGLRVVRTAWHPLAERRVAVVELPAGGGEQSVREGDRVAGALVKRIEPSGVVFEDAGRELRRKIGE